MSFSFTVSGATKDEVRAKANAEMANVVTFQKVHGRDNEAALQTLDVYLGLLPGAPEGKQIFANVAGSVMWQSSPGDPYTDMPTDDQVVALNVSVNVYLG